MIGFVCPPQRTTAIPRVTNHIPRVVRKEGIFSLVLISPFTNPAEAPITMLIGTTQNPRLIPVLEFLIRNPQIIEDRAIIPSIDKSIEPISITSELPRTIIMSKPDKLRTFCRFFNERKDFIKFLI